MEEKKYECPCCGRETGEIGLCEKCIEMEEGGKNPVVPEVPEMLVPQKFLKCPKCGAEILEEIAREKVVCEDCGVPFVDEEKLAKERAEREARAEKKQKAVAKAEEELKKALES